jgi:23S rRNA pseudouridine2605 synthase
VDGRAAKPGDQISGKERIAIDGRHVRLPAATHPPSFIAYYKPTGRGSGDDRLDDYDLPRPKHGRWIDVAALDAKTSGLLVLTTDGELAHALMRSGVVLERLFAVRLAGEPSDGQIERLLAGVDLEDGSFRAASIDRAGGSAVNTWYHVLVRESRHRGLRAAFAAVGLAVNRVIRTRYGPIELGKLRRGAHRALDPAEISALYAAAGIRRPQAAGTHRGRKLK